MARALHWCFTWFDEWDESSDDDPACLYDSTVMEYIVYQLERCPETSRLHIQGFVSFKQRCRLAKAKGYLNSAVHLEKANGSFKQASDYCKKGSSYVKGPWEYGTPPVGKGFRSDLRSAVAAVQEGKTISVVASENPVTYVHYSRGLIALKAQLFPSPPWRSLDVTWVWGTTGVGKTRTAYACDADLYKVIMPGQWWDGYDCQKTILFDDFYGQIKCSDMLNNLDGYKLSLPVKGGFTWAHWTKVFITSNVPPSEAYKVKTDKHTDGPGIPQDVFDAFLRRINEVIKMG